MMTRSLWILHVDLNSSVGAEAAGVPGDEEEGPDTLQMSG